MTMTHCLDCDAIISTGPRCAKCSSTLRQLTQRTGTGPYALARLAGEIIQRVYDAEGNGAVRWFHDGGFEWELWGRSDLEPGEDGSAYLLISVAQSMAEAMCKRAPEGSFAKWWRGE